MTRATRALRSRRPTSPGSPSRRSVPAAILALLVGTAASLMGQSQPPGPVKIVGPTRMALDPVCNARSGVSVMSRLRNDSQTPVDLALAIGDLASKTAGKTAMAIATLIPPQEGTGSEARSKTSLAPREAVDFRVELRNIPA